MKKIGIIGAGISGLYIANLFKKNPKYQVSIFDKKSSLNIDEGYGVQLSVNSIKFLNEIGFNKLEKNEKVIGLARNINDLQFEAIQCDVSDDDSINSSFKELSKTWSNFDGLVHSIGFAPSDQLEGNFVDVTSREGFKVAHDISSYSFTALAKAAKPMLNDSSALLTLTYLGAIQTIPNYNVMGLAKASLEANTRFLAASMGRDNIRVNAICPVVTVTPMFDPEAMDKLKSGISEKLKANVPMKRFANVMEQVSTMLWLCSNEASFITGQAISVDGGLTA